MSHKASAFTLIELLIVVAIIAILAAIAVPNFLEAQTRAKISRVKSDFRTLNTALTSYVVDNNNKPPPDVDESPVNLGAVHDSRYLFRLTTPVAYITSIPNDAFAWLHVTNAPASWVAMLGRRNYMYTMEYIIGPGVFMFNADPLARWALVSPGPDCSIDGYRMGINDGKKRWIYDPTNGSVSWGDLLCTEFLGLF